MSRPIGFIGLGNMGDPLARHVLAAGYPLVVHDLREEARATFRALGATLADSPADVASRTDTVLMSLPTPDIVEAVVRGPAGVLSGSTVKWLVDLSTTGTAMAGSLAQSAADRGVAYVDSPVSGGVGGARKGTLAVMCACAKADFVAMEPLLRRFGKTFHVGEAPGLGQTMKLANNLLSATALAASAEAVLFGVKAGLDPAVMIDVINAGSGRNTATTDKFPRAILPRSFDFGFATGLMYKDVRLCVAEATAAGVPMNVGRAVLSAWEEACEVLGANSDFTRIVEIAERAAGTTIPQRGGA